MASSAEANARIAYCSIDGIYSSFVVRWALSHGKKIHLISSFGYGKGATDVCCTAAIYHAIVDDEVSNYTDCVMQSAFRLVYDLIEEEKLVS
jgi:hypothetical protein